MRSRSLLVVSLILTAMSGFAEVGARIEGRVLDSVTRAPIEDVEVSLAWVGPLPRDGGAWPTRTDDRGRFTFEKIQGKVSLACHVVKPKELDEKIVLMPGVTIHQDVDLP